MKYLISAILIFFSSFAFANDLLWDPQGFPEDRFRGDWFATIDVEAADWAITTQSEITRLGPTAIRFELRDGDCFTANPENPSSGWDDCTRDRERSELRERWRPELDVPVWYTLSIFIPEDYNYMYPKQIIWQWHSDLGPDVYFQLNRDVFLVDILTEVGETTKRYELGNNVLTPGQWHDLTVRAVWSNDQGRFTLFVNGNKVLDHQGATMSNETYANGIGPFVKFGIYRSHLSRWNSDLPHPTQILYFDEYRRSYSLDEIKLENFSGD